MRLRVNLLETWIDQIDLASTVACVDGFVRAGIPRQIVTVNVDFLRLAQRDQIFRDLINTADLAVPDGMPLLWAARALGDPLPERITGIDLIESCARLAAARRYNIFLLGAAPGVAAAAAATLHARYPSIGGIGAYAPPMGAFSQAEEDKMARLIEEMQPDILFVAFGAPRQYQWIRANMQRLGVPVSIGIGGALDMLAGRVKRAPLWMQDNGLEWLFRLAQEPARLWRRYIVDDLPVFCRLMAQSRRDGTAEPFAGLPERLAAIGVETPSGDLDVLSVISQGRHGEIHEMGRAG